MTRTPRTRRSSRRTTLTTRKTKRTRLRRTRRTRTTRRTRRTRRRTIPQSHHCTVAWVTRPERPKGAKDEAKPARRAAK